MIMNNSAAVLGGGINFYNWADGTLNQVTISNNTAGYGGGIYCNESDPTLIDVRLTNNSGGEGGAINGRHSDFSLQDVVIRDNIAGTGGGIYIVACNPVLQNVTIARNTAESGGGIWGYESIPVFDSLDRCNIYLNYAPVGHDLYSDFEMHVIVDTFTVLNPMDYHAKHIDNFTFDILNGKIEQVEADLFVSPTGDDANNGLTYNEPLLHIDHAFSKIITDSLVPRTVNLLNGTYSYTNTRESFPVTVPDYLNLVGESEKGVILDAEDSSAVIWMAGNEYSYISEMTITGGNGGGLICSGNNVILEKLTITENESFYGGGIHCSSFDGSYNTSTLIRDVTIHTNTAMNGGGISCYWLPNLVMENCSIFNNSADNGGGLYLVGDSAIIENTVIANNTSVQGGGMTCYGSSQHIINTLIQGNTAGFGGGLLLAGSQVLVNVDIVDNIASDGGSGIGVPGGYFAGGGDIILMNTILWGEEEQGVYFESRYPPNNHISVSWSDIQDGQAGINLNNSGTIAWLEGNIDQDPLFLDSGEHPYQLNNYSPCINAGTPDTTGLNLPGYDLAGEERIVNNRIDIGAYEWSILIGVDEETIANNIDLQVNLYPNPANKELNISVNGYNIEEVAIYSLAGQKVLQERIINGALDVSSLNTGMYIVEVTIENHKLRQKLLVK